MERSALVMMSQLCVVFASAKSTAELLNSIQALQDQLQTERRICFAVGFLGVLMAFLTLALWLSRTFSKHAPTKEISDSLATSTTSDANASDSSARITIREDVGSGSTMDWPISKREWQLGALNTDKRRVRRMQLERHDSIQQVDTENNAYNQQCLHLQGQIDQSDAKIALLDAKVAELSLDLAEAIENAEAVEQMLKDAEGGDQNVAQKVMVERLNFLVKELDAVTESCNHEYHRVEEGEKQVTNFKGKVVALELQSELEEQRSAEREKQALVALKIEQESLSQQISEMTTQCDKLQSSASQLPAVKFDLEQTGRVVKKLERKKNKLQEERDGLVSEIADAGRKLSHLKAKSGCGKDEPEEDQVFEMLSKMLKKCIRDASEEKRISRKRQLLLCFHPDKNPATAVATRVTQILNSIEL